MMQRIRFLTPALVLSALLALIGCENQPGSLIPTPALVLDTPAPADAGAIGVVPTKIIVVVVTPTPADGGGNNAEQRAAPAQNNSAGESDAANTDQAAAGAGQMDEEQLISMGEQVYATNCASCHQNNGEGTSAYPALNQSATLTNDDPSEAINIVLHGRGQMPAFAETLSSEEIAAVLSYERNSWDNSAPAVSVAQVQESGATNEQETQTPAAAGQQDITTPSSESPTVSASGAMTATTTPTPEANAAAEEEKEADGNQQGSASVAEAEAGSTPSATATLLSEEQLIALGQQTFTSYCAACHQADGQGAPGAYPPLAGNPFVTADSPDSVIEVVVTGRAGMPHFFDYLTTAEIAGVISFIRNNWGNEASTVRAEEVEIVAESVGAATEGVEH